MFETCQAKTEEREDEIRAEGSTHDQLHGQSPYEIMQPQSDQQTLHKLGAVPAGFPMVFSISLPTNRGII